MTVSEGTPAQFPHSFSIRRITMKLDFAQIRSMTMGAVRIAETENGIRFYRFTEEQEALYQEKNPSFYKKSFCTSGVQLRFRTDSRTLRLKGTLVVGTLRCYYAVEVLVNGQRVGAAENFSGVELPPDYTVIKLPYDVFDKSFALGEGMKEVRVLLPWSLNTALQEVELDDGAVIEPVKLPKKMLCFGDSITQGYDALYPSNKYVTQLAELLEAEEINKAIGGDVFYPELAGAKEPFEPDYISVAYGTNDWSKCDGETFEANCSGFFKNIRKNYPSARLIVLTPIWRKDSTEPRKYGEFEKIGRFIRSCVEGDENVTVIEGIDLIEHRTDLYADLRLHPNDEGFQQYFESIQKALNK